MLFDFANILVFVLLGLGFVFFTLVFVWVVSSRKSSPDKSSTYECGERTLGPARVQFNIRFYVIALIYIIFAVEIAVLFPWAVVYKSLGWTGFIEMFAFVIILLIGLAYLWYHGDLDWVKTLKDGKEDGTDRKQI